MSVFTTIVAGVTVFVLCQIILKWLVEPIQNLRESISAVVFHIVNDYSAIQGANIIDKDKALAVSDNLSRLGAKIISNAQLIPFYKRISKALQLPTHDDISFSAKRLLLISNNMFGKESDIHYRLDYYRIEVAERLGFEDSLNLEMTKKQLKDAIDELRKIKSA